MIPRAARLCLFFIPAWAWASARIDTAHCYTNNDRLVVDIGAMIALPPAPSKAVRNGLTLHFVYDFNLSAPRRWWRRFPVEAYHQRLSYNPISQQFILENSGGRLSFANISDALARATHIRTLPVTGLDKLPRDTLYQLAIRLRLDKAQLPVSLSLDAYFNADWHIESDWLSCQLAL